MTDDPVRQRNADGWRDPASVPVAAGTITRLGVIGDVHAENERLHRAIGHLNTLSPDTIICTGDIVDGTGCPDECVRLLDRAGIRTVRGNHDRWLLEDLHRDVPDAHRRADLSPLTTSWLSSLPTQLRLNTACGSLLLCHGVADNDLRKVWPGTESVKVERSQELDQIIAAGEYRYLVNGHMHFRTLIHFEAMTLINAGTLKGVNWPGFSIIDFEQQAISAFEFKGGAVELARVQPLVADEHVIWRNTQAFSGHWEPVRLDC